MLGRIKTQEHNTGWLQRLTLRLCVGKQIFACLARHEWQPHIDWCRTLNWLLRSIQIDCSAEASRILAIPSNYPFDWLWAMPQLVFWIFEFHGVLDFTGLQISLPAVAGRADRWKSPGLWKSNPPPVLSYKPFQFGGTRNGELGDPLRSVVWWFQRRWRDSRRGFGPPRSARSWSHWALSACPPSGWWHFLQVGTPRSRPLVGRAWSWWTALSCGWCPGRDRGKSLKWGKWTLLSFCICYVPRDIEQVSSNLWTSFSLLGSLLR